MRKITNLMDKAEAALLQEYEIKGKKHQLVKDKAIIEKSKVSAIAGFGAVVINLDLLPALAVYENNHPEIVKALGKVIEKDNLFDQAKATARGTLTAQRLLKEEVIDASVALKIMARTFKINDDENK